MSYILILVTILTTGTVETNDLGRFETMTDCFDKRDVVVENLGRPIIDYQVVCVQTMN